MQSSRNNNFAENGHVGAKHKQKAAEKESQVQANLISLAASQSAVDGKSSGAKDGKKTPKKEKKEKKVPTDAQGNELKRPLSAYMLYNNHRRPTLRTEHPGKCPS